MPRQTSYNPFEEHEREIRRLRDELYMCRMAIVALAKPEARTILESYRDVKSREEWYRWPDHAAEQIIDLCADVTQRSYQGHLYEERARCPLCGEGPQSFYDGHAGFKLPEGLRRHLVGYGRSIECSVFGAAKALGREHFKHLKERGVVEGP